MNERVGHWLQIGQLYEELAEWELAETAYRRAIAADPSGLFGYARLATMLKGQLPKADLERIEACTRAVPRREWPERARLFYALANVYGGLARYPNAALAVEAAKGYDAESNKYNSALHVGNVADTIAGYNTAFFDKTYLSGSASSKPIFLVGLPRSGTTLVEQILASHPAVHGAGELDFGYRSAPRPSTVGESVNKDWLPRIAESHLRTLTALGGGKPFVVDKMPDNYLHLGWLATLFPGATFIEVVRDLRDTALSLYMTDFKVLKWTRTPGDIHDRMRCYNSLMEHWAWTLPVKVHQVRYEDLIFDPQKQIERLLAAIGLEWDNNLLRAHENQRPVKTASLTQVRKPLYSTSIGRWKHYADHLPELFASFTDEATVVPRTD